MNTLNTQNALDISVTAPAVTQNDAPLHTLADLQDCNLLTAQQLKALQLLALGKSVAQTAASVGVCRKTVYNWLGDTTFKRSLNRLRHKLWDQANDRLRALVHPALDELEHQLRDRSDRTRYRSANAVLRHANLKKTAPLKDLAAEEDGDALSDLS